MKVKSRNILFLNGESKKIKKQIEEVSRQSDCRLFVLDLSGELPSNAWKTWIADSTKELMLRAGEDVRASWSGPVVTIVKLSSNRTSASNWRPAFEKAALEAVRGVMGSLALERAKENVVANTIIIDEETSEFDLQHTVAYLIDKRYNGYTTGATLWLTKRGYNDKQINGARAKGKVLITGGAGTIGFATAKAFVNAGYEPILCDLNGDALQKRSTELGGVETLQLDVNNLDLLKEKVKSGELGKELAAVALVHGFQGSYELKDLDESLIDSSMAINGTSVYGIIEILQPLLSKGSAISVVSSQCGIRAEAVTAAYCAPKFALIGLIDGLSTILAERGISINALCPGPVDTPFLRAYFERFAVSDGQANDVDEVVKERAAAMPIGCFAKPEEMGEALRFLAELDSTGIVLAPTGGETLT